jgi:hypothetical protein
MHFSLWYDFFAVGRAALKRGPLGDSPHSAAFFFAERGLMFLLYLDDSGSVANKTERHLVLGGLAVYERNLHWFNSQLDAIAASISPTDPKSIEFHASEIYAGRKAWRKMPRHDRIATMHKVLGVLAASFYRNRAFACVVDKQNCRNNNPMEVAFEDLCSRFNLYLRRFHIAKKSEAHSGIIVVDESSYETTLQKLTHDYRALGTKWGTIRHIQEVPLFVDSRASRMVQLADHIAYAIFRAYEHNDNSLLAIIQGKFDTQNGRLHGLAHKTANSSCQCHACSSRP